MIEQVSACGETILLAEDEPGIRLLIARVLGRCGYMVLEARDGVAALELAQSSPARPIDLLVTDLAMPRMSGGQLVAHLVALQPRLKVLFMSGGLETTPPDTGLLAGHSALLAKPFTPHLLAQQVRALLDVGRSDRCK